MTAQSMTIRRTPEGVEMRENRPESVFAAVALVIVIALGIGAVFFGYWIGIGVAFAAALGLAVLLRRSRHTVLIQLPHHALWVDGELTAGTGAVTAIHIEGLGDPKHPGPYEATALVGAGQRTLARIANRENAHEIGQTCANALGVRLIEHLDHKAAVR